MGFLKHLFRKYRLFRCIKKRTLAGSLVWTEVSPGKYEAETPDFLFVLYEASGECYDTFWINYVFTMYENGENNTGQCIFRSSNADRLYFFIRSYLAKPGEKIKQDLVEEFIATCGKKWNPAGESAVDLMTEN